MSKSTPLTGQNQKHIAFRSKYGLVAGLAAITAVPATAAVEITVDTSSDVVSATDGVTSLREAINMANKSLSSDVIINLPAGDYELEGSDNEDGNASGDLDVLSHGNKTVTIRGAGRYATYIDGNSSDRIFDFAAGGNYVIEKLTLSSGYVEGSDGSDGSSNYLDTSGGVSKLLYGEDGGDGGDAYGGAIHLAGGNLIVRDVAFSSCYAEGGDAGDGYEALSWFQVYGGNGGDGGNAAGGAIYADIGSTGSIYLSNVSFYSNYATGGVGGDGGSAYYGVGQAEGGDGGDGGMAVGGSLYIEGTGAITVKHIYAESVGAYGSSGGDGETGYTAGSVEGGDGGDGGSAIGGFAYIDHKGSSATNNIALFSDVNVSSVYVYGGDGGSGGSAENFDYTGEGGNGGDGGNVAGGAMYVDNPQFFHLGNSSTGDYTSFSYIYAYAGDGGSGGDASNFYGAASFSGGGSGGDGGDGGDAFGGAMYINNADGYAQITNHYFYVSNISAGDGGSGGDAYVSNTGTSGGTGGDGGDGGYVIGGALYIENMDKYTETHLGSGVSASVWSASSGSGGSPGSGGWGSGTTGSSGSTTGAYATHYFDSPGTSTFSSASIGNQAWKEQGTTAAVSQVFNFGIDLPLKNIEVMLYDSNGKIVGRTRTDNGGEYYFYTGYTGDAQMKFEVGNQTPLAEGAGASASTDSDNDIEISSSGLTETFTISGNDLSIDAGFADAAPKPESFDLTVHGTVPNAYDALDVLVNGSFIDTLNGVNSGGTGLRSFTISVTLPPNTEYVDIQARDTSDDSTTTRRVYVREVQSGGN